MSGNEENQTEDLHSREAADYCIDLPTSISIEPTTNCNLRCPLCPVTLGMRRPLGEMPVEKFRWLIDGLSPYSNTIKTIYLWNYGEPLTHPGIFNMIRYATDAGFRVEISTNSTLLNESNVENLLNSGVERIKVCLDGIDELTHCRFRVGSNFQSTLNGIFLLCKRKHTGKQKLPYITLQFILMKHNQSQLGGLLKLAIELGVDNLGFQMVDLGSWQDDDNLRILSEVYLPNNSKLHKYNLIGETVEVRQKPDPCNWGVNGSGVVLWNGDVSICCFDAHASYVVGNIYDYNGYINLFNSNTYKQMRKSILNKELDICSRCHISSARVETADIMPLLDGFITG